MTSDIGNRTREDVGAGRQSPDWHEVDTPAFVGARALKALAIGAVAGLAYLLTLMVVSVAEGRSATYPLRAVYAIFNGSRYLPDVRFPRDYGMFQVVKSVAWVVGIGALAAVPPAILTPRRVVQAGRLRLWLAISLGWSTAMFLVAFVLLGFPAPSGFQRSASSFEGVRVLGRPAFALAHVVYGVALALPMCRISRTKVLVRRP